MNEQIGICGEHAADPESIAFFNNIGLDYISSSKYGIPTAKLAAAQSRIQQLSSMIDCIRRPFSDNLVWTDQYGNWPAGVWDNARNLIANLWRAFISLASILGKTVRVLCQHLCQVIHVSYD